jgi:hypothetical protein
MKTQSTQRPRAIFLRGLLRVEGHDFRYRNGEFWFPKKIIAGDELTVLWVNSSRCLEAHVHTFAKSVDSETWFTVFDPSDQDRPLGW